MVFGEESQRAARDVLERVRRALAPHDTGRKYLNFAEQETDPPRSTRPRRGGACER